MSEKAKILQRYEDLPKYLESQDWKTEQKAIRDSISLLMTDKLKIPDEREVWDKAVAEGSKEPRPELKDDRPAIRAALRESRRNHTQKVRSLR